MRAPAQLWTAPFAAASDRYTMDELGVPSPVLMERASLCVAAEVEALCAGDPVPVVVLCGPGNNGGDGLAVARILHGRGRRVTAVLATPRLGDACAAQLALARAHGVPIEDGVPEAAPALAVWVDALLGTGSTGVPRGGIATALSWVAGRRGPMVAVDGPTGVDLDTGAVPSPAFVADLTVTFVRSKPGLHVTPGRRYAGRVVVADIGITPDPGQPAALRVTDPEAVMHSVASLSPGAHKGERGHVAVLGGGEGTPGAAILAGTAAMRAGAGLVTVVTPAEDVRAQLVAYRPELMVAQWSDPLHPAARALVVGPGLTDADPVALAKLWVEDPRPALWDASALDHIPLAGEGSAGARVITPHPGEAARLLARRDGALPDREADEATPAVSAGWTAKRVQSRRLEVARELAALTGAVVVLKGEGTVIASEADGIEVAVAGGPELATAGSGDVLAGLGGALLARGLSPTAAAAAAVHIHGVAGTRAAARRPGVVASDLADALAEAMLPDVLERTPSRYPLLRRG